MCCSRTPRARKFKKKSRQKKPREIKYINQKNFSWTGILGNFKLFPLQKLSFGHFSNSKKFISWVFLYWTFLNSLAHCEGIWTFQKNTVVQILRFSQYSDAVQEIYNGITQSCCSRNLNFPKKPVVQIRIVQGLTVS